MSVLLEISALFILMTLGFVLGKIKIVDSSAVKGISSMIVKVTLPAQILMSLQKPFTRALLGESLQTLLVATLFYIGIILISIIAVKILGISRKKASTLIFALCFSNCGFIGFPVVTSILGGDSLFLTSIHNIIFNILAFSVGILIIAVNSGTEVYVPGTGTGTGYRRPVITLKQILNNNVLAAIIGFIFFIASFTLPRFIALPLEMLSELTTPLAMIVTGAMLARTPIKTVATDWQLYVVALLRLAVWPLVTAIVLKLCGITGNLYYITIIISGMPAASNTSLIAEVYGGDTDTASAIVFMTTLFSVVSIPLLAMLMR